ncbi:uncharacterized protein LOC117123885 [Anneissia japonica]|uniref:uncharacterized protein LOC117123885 n=1 Tax=Anneissia japonica TaxID=1529436 RepID=UPI00142552FE|nr:uncharacterized protein LOC117123885 [Anneissia japonica]XP_033125830.1 uncharacterized protein LOC117123885 [Anneissia japonica]XP_033125831.1 uncharacterized protein LOC117123885 [Anneissia japonica]
MLKFITQRLRAQSLNEIQPFVLTVKEVYSDSEDENKEVELLFKDRKLTPNGSNPSGAALQARQKPLEDSSSENIQNERDCNSSEEELLNIEKLQTDNPITAKRKWSRVSRWSISGDSSSGDEEIKDLIKPVPLKFSSSPPHQIQNIKFPDNKTAIFLANVGPAIDSVSPRKRCRADSFKQRPSLDFEKMQQKTIVKKRCPYGVRAARTVRIRSVSNNNSRIPPRLLCDPAIFSFRSLSTISPITPVEDSGALTAC